MAFRHDAHLQITLFKLNPGGGPARLHRLGLLAINLIFGSLGIGAPGDVSRIAWEAHAGGFMAGLLLFGLFYRGDVA